MTEWLNNEQFDFPIEENKNIGLITSTSFWGLPLTVVDFLDRIKIRGGRSHYIYPVLTNGTTTGKTHHMMNRLQKSRGLLLGGKFIILIVDTWIPSLMSVIKNQTKKYLPRLTGR